MGECKASREAEPGLAAAVTRLEASDRAPKWFTEPGIRPGQWVHFEAPMSYEDLGGAVVFLDVDQADELYPSGGRVRLLLHGSSKHLVGLDAPELPPRVRSDGGSLWPQFVQTMTPNDEKNVEFEVPRSQHSNPGTLLAATPPYVEHVAAPV